MNNWPTWIPKPNSWLSAVLLILLVRGIAVVIRRIFEMGFSLMDLSPKMQIILYFATLLSPILAIAIVHHWLHVFLDRYSPNTRSPELGRSEGIFPSLMSWWEGLYGWMTISLAFLLGFLIQIMFWSSVSFSSFYDILRWWEELRDLFTIGTLLRLVITAYLYEFEHTVRHHLMAIGAANQVDR